MSQTADNIAKVRARIQQAARENRRDAGHIRLVAISKLQKAPLIRDAFAAGQQDFGESYVQEWQEKRDLLADLPLIWHFVGPLQSNKTLDVAQHAHWLHSLDRLKIAERLSAQRPQSLPALNVCIQINIDGEARKAGISSEDLPEFASKVAALPGLTLRGLMAIPDPTGGADGLESAFSRMALQFQSLQRQFPHLGIDTLSMGMSADLERAIAHGSTLLRIGTDIFGARSR